MGSNMAEQHPVGFQWVIEAKERGAKLIHVDPRFTRTSALADIYAPIRSGTDIVFLGALIHYVIENEKYFKDYVVNYTNAATLVNPDFATHDIVADGLFKGWDAQKRQYDTASWQYQKEQGAAAAPPPAQPQPGTLSESYSQQLG